MTTANTSQWLSQTFSSLLSAPHISIPRRPGGIIMGPGPIDLFTTRFLNTFTENVQATVAGQTVTRDQLKSALLNVQKQWNPTDVQFEQPLQPKEDDVITTLCSWTPKDSDKEVQMQISAGTIEDGGRLKINILDLEGDVFQGTDYPATAA